MALGNNFSLKDLKPNRIPTTLQGNILIYSEPKKGKTSTIYNLYKDKAIFLCFERGYLYIDGLIGVDITKPSDLQKVVRELKKDEKQTFDTVVFDTVDIFADMYEKYTCQLNGVTEISKIAWGAGWKIWQEECNKVIMDLMSCGYNLVFISHATEKSMVKINDEGKEEEYTKIVPTCPKRILNLVAKNCDHIWYIGQEREGNKEVRYVYTRDTESFQAGSRLNKLVPKILLDAEEIKKQIKIAVEKEENTTDEEIKPIVFEEVDFEQVKQEVVSLVMDYFHPNDKMDEVTRITDDVLGLGMKINDLERGSEEALEIIKLKLEDKIEELGLTK